MTQILAMVQSLALAALTLTKHINIHEIIWLSAFQGLINAFDMPANKRSSCRWWKTSRIWAMQSR